MKKHFLGLLLLLLLSFFASAYYSLAQEGDSDGDGISDAADDCPLRAGPASAIAGQNGCPVAIATTIPDVNYPDKDGDGTFDTVDLCPDTSGPAWASGCPDTDGDSVLDLNDECPNLVGLVNNQGCPIPDSDNDGFNDEEDICPNLAGRVQGCTLPIIPPNGLCSLATRDANNVNIRLSPSLSSEIVGQILFSDIILIQGFLDNEEGHWFRIEEAWVFGGVVRTGGLCADLPILDASGQAIQRNQELVPENVRAWIDCPETNIVHFTFVGAPNRQYIARLMTSRSAQEQPQVTFIGGKTDSLIIPNPNSNNEPLTSIGLRISEIRQDGRAGASIDIVVDLSCSAMPVLNAWIECPETNIIHFTFVGAPNRRYIAYLPLFGTGAKSPNISFDGGQTDTLMIPSTNGGIAPLMNLVLRISEQGNDGRLFGTVTEVIVDLTCSEMEELTAFIECPETNIVYFSFVGAPNYLYNARLSIISGEPNPPNISFYGGETGALLIPSPSGGNQPMTSVVLHVARQSSDGKLTSTIAEVTVDLSCSEMEELTAWVTCPENNLVYFNFVGAPNHNYNARLAMPNSPNISFSGGETEVLVIPSVGNTPMQSVELLVERQQNNGTVSATIAEVTVDLTCRDMEALTAFVVCPETSIIHFSFVGTPNYHYNARLALINGSTPPNVSFNGGGIGTLVIPASLPDNPPLTSISLSVHRQENDGRISPSIAQVVIDLSCGDTPPLSAWIECPTNNLVHFSFVGAPNRQYSARLVANSLPLPAISFAGGYTGLLNIPNNLPDEAPLSTIRLEISYLGGKVPSSTSIDINLICSNPR